MSNLIQGCHKLKRAHPTKKPHVNPPKVTSLPDPLWVEKSHVPYGLSTPIMANEDSLRDALEE